MSAAAIVFSALTAAQAAGPFTSVAQDMRDREYAPVRRYLVAAAELMPAEHYEFRPAEGVRTFGDEVAHATGVNFRLCGMASGATAKPPVQPPSVPSDPAARKSAIVDRLKASLAACDEVLQQTTDELLLKPTTGPYIRTSHLTALLGHMSHVYGKLSLMLRMRGLVPPSSVGK